MLIDYLSPLPPVRSGISDYSVDLLPHLQERAAARGDRVRVARLPGQEVAPEVAERFRPVAAAELDASGGPSLPLYQMGNNRHHRPVLERALEVPGVVTLHDLVLHHLLLTLTLGPDGIGGEEGLGLYTRRLRADHGWMGEAVARAKFWGGYGDMPTFALPAHRTLLSRQRGVLVHSRWAAAAVARANPQVRVRAVPMGVPLPPPADRRAGLAFRRRLGIPPEAPVVGCFGFQTPIKRTLSAVRALARPELAGTRRVGTEPARLLIVGEVSEVLDLEGEARRAGVADRIHVTGYVDFDDFQAAIGAADVAVNLRYPTAGETSASLLRILAAGRPAVVSDYAQFAELPEGLVAKVPLGEDEVPALAATLSGLLADRGALERRGQAARSHVAREHDPARAAEAVLAVCREWEGAEPPAEQSPPSPDPPPPTSLAWSRLPGRLAVSGHEGWEPGGRRRLAVRLENHGPATWLAGEGGAGGVAVQARLETAAGDLLESAPWTPLPRDLAAGEALELELALRRPPGPAQLVLEPHVLGGFGFSELGGPVWEARWDGDGGSGGLAP